MLLQNIRDYYTIRAVKKYKEQNKVYIKWDSNHMCFEDWENTKVKREERGEQTKVEQEKAETAAKILKHQHMEKLLIDI